MRSQRSYSIMTKNKTFIKLLIILITAIVIFAVLMNSNVLQAMISNGVACCIEQTKDDSGVSTKHYHFGTEREIQKKFWTSVDLANQGNLPTGLSQAIKNYNTYNEQARSTETKRNTVQEN